MRTLDLRAVEDTFLASLPSGALSSKVSTMISVWAAAHAQLGAIQRFSGRLSRRCYHDDAGAADVSKMRYKGSSSDACSGKSDRYPGSSAGGIADLD